jgi:hypothetical protein
MKQMKIECTRFWRSPSHALMFSMNNLFTFRKMIRTDTQNTFISPVHCSQFVSNDQNASDSRENASFPAVRRTRAHALIRVQHCRKTNSCPSRGVHAFGTFLFPITATQTGAVGATLATLTRTTPAWTGHEFSRVRGISQSRKSCSPAAEIAIRCESPRKWHE